VPATRSPRRHGPTRRTHPSASPSTRPPDSLWARLGPRKQRLAIAALIVAAAIFAAGWTPPAATVHDFTTASDYNADRDSGCTNSGEGCHGSEDAYTDFNDYHPDTGCGACHSQTGVGCIPCHTPDGHECTDCHDGTMDGASDCVRLEDPYPSGHYRETTHTAMGTDMDVVMRAAEDGEAQLPCSACHSRDLRSSHTSVPVAPGSDYGSSIGCGECHNDVRSFGMAEVLNDWPEQRCEDCHRIDSSSPMHAAEIAPSVEGSGTLGCGLTGTGCHVDNDVHALHPDVPKNCAGSSEDGEPGCHDLAVESHKPTATACGGGGAEACHRPYVNDAYSHEHDLAVHSPETRGPARDRSFYGVECGDCHHMGPGGTSLVVEHELATSEQSELPQDGCRNCHNHPASAEAVEDDWADRDTRDACRTCHDGDRLDTAHPSGISGLHTVSTGSEGCASTGVGCHPGADLSAVGSGATAIHDDCLTCHDRTSSGTNLAYDPSRKTCGSGRDCHAETGVYDPETGAHDGSGTGGSAVHDAGPRQAASLFGDSASGSDVACDTCHGMDLCAEHLRPNATLAGTDVCVRCHNDSPATAGVIKSGWLARDTGGACEACHGEPGVPTMHEDVDEVHEATQLDRDGEQREAYCSRPGCHDDGDVRVVHADVGCANSRCHTTSGDIRGSGVMTCGGLEGQESCHVSGTRHLDKDEKHIATQLGRDGEPRDEYCSRPGCHGTADVTELHETTRCSTEGCHVEGGPTYMTCGGLEGQESCHVSGTKHLEMDEKHAAEERDPAGDPVPGTCQKSGCHSTANAKDLHVDDRCSTAGCHVEGGPTYMSCGGPNGTDACHTGPRDPDHSADASGTVGGVTYGPGENVGCLGTCHATDLRPEHKKWFDLGEMEGNPASFCRACHYNPDDPGSGAYANLPAVATALANDDCRCVACHMSPTGDGPVGVAAPPSGTCTATVAPTALRADPMETFKIALARSIDAPLTVAPARPEGHRTGEHRDVARDEGAPEPAAEATGTGSPEVPAAEEDGAGDASEDTTAAPGPETGEDPDAPDDTPVPGTDDEPDATEDDPIEEDAAEPECERNEDATSVAAAIVSPAVVDTRVCLTCHTVTESTTE
jgi:hypothetical protein